MKRLILCTTFATFFVTSVNSKADVCDPIKNFISNECNNYKWYDPNYWQCKSFQLIAARICATIKFQIGEERAASLQAACSRSDPQACKNEFKKDFPRVMAQVEEEEKKEESPAFENKIISEVEEKFLRANEKAR